MEQKTTKLTASPEVDPALDRMVQATNEGFGGGKVTKQDLVSWIVLYFEKHCFQDCLEKIRQDHFDQVAYLESVLKQAKQARKEGQDALNLTSLLSPLVRSGKPEKSRPQGSRAENASLLPLT